MPIIYFVNECNKFMDDDARGAVANYIARSEKFLLGGYGVNLYDPAGDMQRLAESFGKDSRKRLYHFIIAFRPSENIYPSQLQYHMNTVAAQIGEKHQVFYGIHTDKQHLHVHLMMNAVGNDGMKFRGNWESLRWVEGIIRSSMRWLTKDPTRMVFNNKVPDVYMNFTG